MRTGKARNLIATDLFRIFERSYVKPRWIRDGN